MDDFYVTVSDGEGVEQTVLIWVPLGITAYNVVLEYGESQLVAEKASAAVVNHGKEIDYDQNLTVRRQVIMSARKAADAVIEELGNGDVAAAVLEAVREGGEILAAAKASGIVIDAMSTRSPDADSTCGDNDSTSWNNIHITLSKPMGIIFEPIGDAQERGVRIRELPRDGKAYLSKKLKVGDELLSMNNKDMSDLSFYEIIEYIADEDNQKRFDMVFQRQDKREMKAAMGKRFRNLIKRGSHSNNGQQADQRDDETQGRRTPSPKSKKPFSFFRLRPSSSNARSQAQCMPMSSSFACVEADVMSDVMKLLGCVDPSFLYDSSGHSLESASDFSSVENVEERAVAE